MRIVTTLCYRYQHICCSHDVYRQSKNTRIDMAERMRKLPLSFFSKKDPTDLTVRMMGDVTVQESLLSAWLPILLASLVFTPLICIIVIVWSPILGLAIAWPVPVALIIVASSSKIQKRLSESKHDKVEAISEMVQEAIECSADLKANGAQKQYLDRVRKALYSVEGAETRSELGLALFVSTAQLVLKLGLATTALVGVSLLINGSISLIVFIVHLKLYV